MKTWLIKTAAPYCGTEQYYSAYAEEKNKLLDWLYANWFDEECQNLWDDYSFHLQEGWDSDWEEMDEEEKEELYDNSYDNYTDQLYSEWCEDCSLSVSECSEEDWDMYVPGGEGHLDIIYDERVNNEK